MRIRHRLVIAFATVLVPLLLLEVHDVAREFRERRADILRGHRDTAEAVAAGVEALLRDLVDRARAVARAALASGDPAGEIRGRFEDLRQWGRNIATITWADPGGRIVLADPPELLRAPVTIADRPFFRAVVGGGDWAVGDLIQSRLEEGEVFVVAAAARAGDRSLRGVALIGVRPEIFERSLPRLGGSGPQVTVAIVDRTGRALFIGGRPEIPWEQRDWAGAPSIQQALRGEAVVVEEVPSSTDGKSWLGVRVPIRMVGWVASVTTPVDEAMAPVWRAARVRLGVLAGITLLSLGLAVLLGRGIGRPIEALRARAQALAGGALGRRPLPPGKDEVAELGAAFHQMAAHLEDSLGDARATAREAAEKAARLAALTDLSRRLVSTLDPDQLLSLVVTSGARLLDSPVVAVWVLDRGTGELALRARVGMGSAEPRPVDRFRRGEGLVGWIWEHRRPLVVSGMGQDARTLHPDWVRAEGLRGFVGVPLMAGAECIGVLCGMRADERPFTPADQELLEAVAAHAAAAMENARFSAEAGSETTRLLALNAVARLITSSLDLERVLQFVVRSAADLLGNAVAYFLVLDESSGELRVRAATGWRHPELRRTSAFRVGEGLPGLVAASRQPVAIPDALQDPRFVNVEWAKAEGLRGFAGAPLLVGERCVGVLCVMRRSTAPWTPEDLDLLAAFCAQAAVAMQNARLYGEAASRAAELDRRSHALEALNETARLISSESHFLPLLQKIAESARRLAGSRYAALGVLGEGGRLAHFIQSGLSEEEAGGIGDLPTGKGILGVMLRQGCPLRLEDLGADPRAAGFPPNHPSMRSFMGVPILAEGRVLGSLYLTEKLGGAAFTEEDERLLTAFAAHAAIALQQARLVEQTRRDAATKATLLRELHHRVRNNLASIVGLLTLEQTRAGQRSAEDAIQACIERVHSIAAVHESLATGEFGAVEVNRVLEAIARSCFQRGTPGPPAVAVRVEGPPLLLPSRHLTALAIIANEVLINASKHAFPGRDRGRIAIRISEDGDRITVEIRDDGIGLAAPPAGEGSGLGLEIVQALARADLGGDFHLYSEGGTVAVVTFPKPQPQEAQKEALA